MAKDHPTPSASTGPAPVEREIKLAVPSAPLASLRNELIALGAQPIELHAIYHDVEGNALSRARVSLRLRKEEGSWVQTVKAPGAGALERLEDEVPLGTRSRKPVIDLARHASADVQRALRHALKLKKGDAWPAVLPVFEVKVRRLAKRLQVGVSTVELALDEGRIVAAGRSQAVRELEIELVEGNTQDLLAAARQWRERWGLWVSTSSKAARGHLLAAGQIHAAAAGAQAPAAQAKPRSGPFTAAVLDACMAQVAGNAGEVASGSLAEDHIHQLRVGLRRLRTALRELPLLAADRERLEPVLTQVFRALGERRDRTHVLHAIEPMVEAKRGRPMRIPPSFHRGADPVALVRGAAFQDALLALLARADAVRNDTEAGARKAVRARLRKLHRQVRDEGREFTRLSEERQHRIRKRLKRLRYLAEFASALYPAKDVARFVRGIKPAQDALGSYNDEVMAQALYEELAPKDPDAAFGARLLEQRRPALAKDCAKALRKLAAVQRFWS